MANIEKNESTVKTAEENAQTIDDFVQAVIGADGPDLTELLSKHREAALKGDLKVSFEAEENTDLPECGYGYEGPATVTLCRYYSLKANYKDVGVTCLELAAKFEVEHFLSGTPDCCLHYSKGNWENNQYVGEAWCTSCWDSCEDLDIDRIAGDPLQLVCSSCNESSC